MQINTKQLHKSLKNIINEINNITILNEIDRKDLENAMNEYKKDEYRIIK